MRNDGQICLLSLQHLDLRYGQPVYSGDSVRVGLITNHIAGKGLALDAELLSAFLVELGHETVNVQFDQPCEDHFDLAISLEVVNENFFSLAPKHIWIPNLEWTKNEYLLHARKFDRIWAKTLDAEKVLRSRFPHVSYTGFLSRDRRDESVPRERKFLHVGGDSGLKNTNAVIAAWRQWKYWLEWDSASVLDSPLTVISRSIQTDVVNTDGITFLKEVTDDELRVLQNSHLFHLQPSAYEGWGHAIRESQSVGAVLLTTRAGPMVELHAPFEVDPTSERKVYMATAYNVSGREIREKVGVMLEQPSQMIAKYQVDMRGNWEQEYRESKRRMEKALVEVMRGGMVTSSSVTPESVKPVLAILGNFRPEHSTENDLAYTLQDMGYSRLCFQEDEIQTQYILKMCEDMNVALLIYVHTHGWSTPGEFGLDELWKRLEKVGTKTCSFHLDRFWNLNANDRREDNIGRHPFWHIPCFTADGGNQSRFAERGIQHYWLPPGSSKRWSVDGNYRPDLAVDIGFVGAREYHDQEYPFRGELISFLEKVYGDRFRLFQGYRGQELNDLYKSVKVVVGDSCFANQPGGVEFYYSDRVPESINRGAFLLHPTVKGLNYPGLTTYTPGDFTDLTDKIDWFILQNACQIGAAVSCAWVRENETYHNRMATLLSVMGV